MKLEMKKNNKTNCLFIIFILEFEENNKWISERMGVAYLASVVRKRGYTCNIMSIKPSHGDEVFEKIKEMSPDLIGLSIAAWDVAKAVPFGKKLRETVGPSIKICIGGIYPSSSSSNILSNPDWDFVDILAKGEGESVIGPLLDGIINNKDLKDVPGLLLRNDCKTDQFAKYVDDLDSLAWPVRDQLEEYIQSIPIVTVIVSRGCSGNCSFCCIMDNLYCHKKKKWRGRSPKDIVDEVEYIKNKYGKNVFSLEASTFEDPNNRIGKERMREIANLIIERNLNIFYNISIRARSWSENDDKLLQLMYLSGLEIVFAGIESGSDRMLKLMRKSSTVEDNARVLKLYDKNNIYVKFGFIIFHPYATWDDLDKNAEFLLQNSGHQLERFLIELEVYPGSEDFRRLHQDNLLDPSFHESFNPLAYHYEDPQIERFLRSIKKILCSTNIDAYSLKTFKHVDDNLSIKLLRYKRIYGHEQSCNNLLQKYTDELHNEHNRLCELNKKIWSEIIGYGKRDEAVPDFYFNEIGNIYKESIKKLSNIDLRVNANLIRLGKQIKI